MSGMFANSSNVWDTWIAEIHAASLAYLGINEDPKISDAKVFPNPVNDNFTMEFSLQKNTDITISVTDMNGRLVKELYNGKASSGDNVFSFNKANLSAGTYLLTIKSGTQIIKNEKIIIVN